MAALTFSEVRTDCLRQIDELSGSGSATATLIIDKGITESYAEIAALRDWKTLEDNTTVTTTSGTMEYTPVTNSASVPRIRRIESILDETNNRYLEEVTRQNFEQVYPYVNTADSANQGSPTLWFPSSYSSNRDIKVKFWPVPNATMTLRVFFYFEPVKPVADDHIFLIPDQFHYGLAYLPMAKYYEFQKDPAASYYRQLHAQFKQEIMDAEWGDTTEMPQVQPKTASKGFVIGKLGRIYNS